MKMMYLWVELLKRSANSSGLKWIITRSSQTTFLETLLNKRINWAESIKKPTSSTTIQYIRSKEQYFLWSLPGKKVPSWWGKLRLVHGVGLVEMCFFESSSYEPKQRESYNNLKQQRGRDFWLSTFFPTFFSFFYLSSIVLVRIWDFCKMNSQRNLLILFGVISIAMALDLE